MPVPGCCSGCQKMPPASAWPEHLSEALFHENAIHKELNFIRRMKTGRALFRELASGQGVIFIMPFIHWDFREHGNKMNSTAARIGGDSRLLHTKYMWGPTGTAGAWGPGSNPDETLFHELVHGARHVKGIRDK